MKAAVYYETGAPSVFRYEEVPDPPCHPNGVLIDVKAISIEGGDTLNRAGGEMAGKPHIVGYQCAGIIREVGANVTDRTVGQAVVAVMGFGSHASMASVPAGFTESGLPVGLQIVGRHRDDWSVLQLAHAFEQATRHGSRRPTVARIRS